MAKKATKKTARSSAKPAAKRAVKRPTQRPVKRSLATYQSMRDFNQSPEPSGKAKNESTAKPTKKPAYPAQPGERFFCVQKHDASRLHYDFRLEHRGVLLSWAVPKGPSLNPKEKRLAMQVEDHPLDYGDFEGVIPSGYGAGTVLLWDRGTWTPDDDDIDAALEAGELKFSLDGTKLKGSWVLIRTAGKFSRGSDKPSWLLMKHKDEWAGAVDITARAPLSVKTFETLDQIAGRKDAAKWQSHR
ncbi:MAG TPA: DNA polymerase ligase N-terminal domain-containing protein [Tepidisphaeraceae bacterium]|jgi:bifunctional non-homologous end joining protein LigD|nr:DNA polymerase ligase N-terminal domain-containing protein [Tepidisphaeraceae bacterium]